MRRLSKFAVTLYPRWWRERYGDEFAALLEDARPGLRSALDIAKSALWLQLTTYTLKRVVLTGAFAGVLAGIIAGLVLTPQLVSTGHLILMAPDTTLGNAPRILGNEFERLTRRTLSNPNLASIIRKLDLYHNERARMTSAEVLGLMKRSTSISMATRATNSTTIAIRFEYSEPRKAMLTVEELTTALQQANRSMWEDEARPEVRSFRTVLPTVTVNPGRRNLAFAGLGLGLVLGSLTAAVLHLRRRRSTNLASVGPTSE